MATRVSFCLTGPLLDACCLDAFAFQFDTYVGCEHRCCYCYALNDAKTDWAKEILGHKDLANTLTNELSRIPPQTIYIGWDSDPYQPAEQAHGQTRLALETLRNRGFSACILTKSDLVVRDADLLRRMPGASVGFSFAFQADEDRQCFEAHTPANERRIIALTRLKEAGIKTYALICPVMPFITNVEVLCSRLAQVVETIWIYPLSMHTRSSVNWQNVYRIIKCKLAARARDLEDIVFSSNHTYWTDLRHHLNTTRFSMCPEIHVCL